MSESTFGRIERARLPHVTVSQLTVACAAVGLKFAARPYPDGNPARDAAHLGLLQRLRDQLLPGTIWRTEVPMPIPGDRRAWDAQCEMERTIIGVEAEMRLFDLQALERRINLKRRDSRLEIVILLVADTPANRRLLSQHREALRSSFPLDTRAMLNALRAGRAPRASGIVLL